MKRMKRFTYALALLALAGLGFAQTPTQDTHTFKVIIPPILKVLVDAQEVLFDFSDQNVGNGTLTVGNNTYKRASEANYELFLDSGNPSEVFAPTRIDNNADPNNLFVTLTVLTNLAEWTVSVAPASGSALPAPLDNTRIRVFAEKLSGKGNALTTNGPVSLPQTGSVNLAQATSGGQGKSQYKIYHLLELRSSDEVSSTYTGTVTLVYTIATP